jgi:hypothetical protein
MSLSRILGLVISAAVAIYVFQMLRDPHRTALPFGSTDLSRVEGSLRKLPADERALVEEYVKRSHGDVLIPSLADAESPLTARTFGEAIALERKWQIKMSAQKSVSDSRAADRDRTMAPLREAVSASVAHSEIVRRDEFSKRDLMQTPQSASGAKRGYRVDDSPVFVVTVAIDNHGDDDIVELKGSLQARDRDAYLPVDLCWVDLNLQHTIPARGHTEITCANPNFIAGASQRDFIADPPGRFTVVWEPKLVRTSDGKVMQTK